MCFMFECCFFFSSRRRHTSCALVTGVQTCALPILFREYDPELLPQTAGGCAELLSSENGFQTALDLIRSTLSEDLRETAYALAVEVAAADGRPGQEELRILEVIRHHLGIDRLIAADRKSTRLNSSQ